MFVTNVNLIDENYGKSINLHKCGTEGCPFHRVISLEFDHYYVSIEVANGK